MQKIDLARRQELHSARNLQRELDEVVIGELRRAAEEAVYTVTRQELTPFDTMILLGFVAVRSCTRSWLLEA